MLRYSTITVAYHDAKFVDGVTVEPITGKTMQRMRMAYGPECCIEPADEETFLMIVEHLQSIGKTERAAELLTALGYESPAAAADPNADPDPLKPVVPPAGA